MKRLNWKKAKLVQLYNIAFDDDEAPIEYRIAAQEEIKRRNRQKQNHGRVNFREKKGYGR